MLTVGLSPFRDSPGPFAGISWDLALSLTSSPLSRPTSADSQTNPGADRLAQARSFLLPPVLSGPNLCPTLCCIFKEAPGPL